MCPGPPVFVSQTPRNRRHAYACTEPTRRPLRQGPAGLTTAQVRKRIQAFGCVNTPRQNLPHQTVKRIVLEKPFSFFNIIFYIIAGFLIAVGSFRES